jgi:hypothetical protein
MPAGWSTSPGDRTGGMSAEKELELLRAQVQDIARVCKVSCRVSFGPFKKLTE